MADLLQDIQASLPVLTKLVFSQPVDKASVKNATFRSVVIQGQVRYQTETIRDNKAFHKNYTESELLQFCAESFIGAYRQVLIARKDMTLQYVLGTKGYKKTSKSTVPRPADNGGIHNRGKNYVLNEGEKIPALVDLGVFTADYQLIQAKSDKFRQINRFVELVDQAFRDYQRDEITILDFGCGKSYLTFILYYYFVEKRGLKTTIIGYDLKTDVVEKCNEIAKKYGYNKLKFIRADVVHDVLYEEKIDMVVTLHACDIATDYALKYAVTHGAKRIFSVPCCQHEINRQIKPGGDLDILLRYGIVQERISALLTDAIRASVLEDLGYSVDLIEFVDFEHSPKNIMIRASYTGKKQTGNIMKAAELAERYGFRQTLLDYALELQSITAGD